MKNKLKKLISSLLIETELKEPFIENLSDQVVVLTGGTGKLGKAIARVLAKKGARVIVLSRSTENKKEGLITYLKTDVTDRQMVKDVMQKINGDYGQVDVLINCAGLFSEKEIELTSEEEYDTVMDTNVKGIFITTSTVVPHMKKRGKGLIINIGSKISHNTNVAPNKVLYATSKYAVEGFSLALSQELKRFGIRVTCLMLGTVNTFVSLKSKEFMAPENVAFVISTLIRLSDIDFESIVMKSITQNI